MTNLIGLHQPLLSDLSYLKQLATKRIPMNEYNLFICDFNSEKNKFSCKSDKFTIISDEKGYSISNINIDEIGVYKELPKQIQCSNCSEIITLKMKE